MTNQNNKPNLPDNKSGKIVQIEKSEMFSGPVPHPEIIERYEKIYPGAAKMIFEEWDNQVKHRQGIEKSVIKTDNLKSLLGVFFGFIIAMTTILGGIYTAVQGKPFLGGALSFTGLAMLVTAFITNKKTDEKKK
jgi:uncharacterized membrane protein